MDKTVYICRGTCGAVISEGQYNQGFVACGAQKCTKHRQPFTKAKQCVTCNATYRLNEIHRH